MSKPITKSDYENLRHILFLDIETVSASSNFQELNDRFKELWTKKAAVINRAQDRPIDELYFEKAGIYAEFGKIVVIGIGMISFKDEVTGFRAKAFAGHDEKQVLSEFNEFVNTKLDPSKVLLCAHNGKEFDFPYLSRRMLVHGLEIPEPLQLSGKKPWEVKHLDTLEMWKFGDFKSFTSLDLLAALFDIPTSKGDIDGSKVNEYYHQKNELEMIAEYCKRDVEVLAKLYLKISGFDLF